MDNLLYNRQQKLNLFTPKSIAVVGVGGTGAWVALLAAMSGIENITLFDADHLEISNFNRIPLPPDENIGKPKTQAIAELIAMLRPDCTVRTEGRADAFSLSINEGNILVDCTDNQDTQKMLANWAIANNRQYIRCGYDGTHFSVLDSVPTWRTTATATTGYAVFPSWVVPAVIPAALAVAKMMYCPSLNLSADLSELGGKK